MALEAGTLHFTIEFAQGLKDKDWFGRQDPYAKVICGAQQFRTRTHTDGGKNPVWNQTFSFGIINENSVEIRLYDSDTMSRDDPLGTCHVSLAKVRSCFSDHQQVPVISAHRHKQHGMVSVNMRFEPNRAYAAAAPAYAPNPYHAQPPAPQYHAAPSFTAPPQPYYAPPAPQPYYAPAPSQSYAYQAMGGQPAPYPYPQAAAPPMPAPAAPAPPGYYPPPVPQQANAYPPVPMKFY